MTGGRGFGQGEHPDELLSASLSGDLTAAERSSLDAHLAGCDRCRATLDAFAEERRLIGGLRELTPPRDLGARVRSGIEAAELPWWRRPATLVGAVAGLATVAAALLAVAILSGLPQGPIGATQEASASVLASAEPSVTASEAPSTAPSVEPSAVPSPPLALALDPGDLGYLSLEGESLSPSRLYFVKDATGESVQPTAPGGPPIAAALSPTREWLAYITEVGLSGADQVWLLNLRDGSTQVLGCSVPKPFTDRLAWSDDGRFLAYTLAAINLGGGVDCGGARGDGSATDVWVFDAAASGEAFRLTETGDAFAGDFTGSTTLLVSRAAAEPYSVPTDVVSGAQGEPIQGIFLPLFSPDGTRALFWRGQMTADQTGAWRFGQGGMPFVSGEPVDGQPSWSGEPLFADLEQPGGVGFESGQFTWGADSDALAFWNGSWTGAPQDDAGIYPSSEAAYVGRRSAGLLSEGSTLELGLDDTERIVSLTLDPDGPAAVVTIGIASAGIGDPPSAYLVEVPLDGGRVLYIGGAPNDQPWNGPAVIGEEAVALPQ